MTHCETSTLCFIITFYPFLFKCFGQKRWSLIISIENRARIWPVCRIPTTRAHSRDLVSILFFICFDLQTEQWHMSVCSMCVVYLCVSVCMYLYICVSVCVYLCACLSLCVLALGKRRTVSLCFGGVTCSFPRFSEITVDFYSVLFKLFNS